MRKVLKRIGIILGTILAILVALVAGLALFSQISFKRVENRPVYAITADMSPEGIAHGEYLVRNVGGCVDCHSEDPLNPDFSGTTEIFEQGPVSFLFAPSNITQDKETGIGSWTDAEIARAIREGIDKDGRRLVIMPSFNYHSLSDADLSAIVGYLRTVEPIKKQIPDVSANLLGKAVFSLGLMSDSVGEPIVTSIQTPSKDSVEYGRYMATIAGCRDCHGENLDSLNPMNLPPGMPGAPDLTSSGNVGSWSADEFINTLRTGKRPDGRQLSDEMPWKVYGQMNDEDLDAIYHFLISLPDNEVADSNE